MISLVRVLFLHQMVGDDEVVLVAAGEARDAGDLRAGGASRVRGGEARGRWWARLLEGAAGRRERAVDEVDGVGILNQWRACRWLLSETARTEMSISNRPERVKKRLVS